MQVCTHRSMTEFILGIRTPLRTNPRIAKDGIEEAGELPIPVPDQES